jgi:glutamate carboxypeptidase
MGEVQTAPSSYLDRLQARLSQLLADLEQLVCCESPSHDLDAVAASAELLVRIGSERLGQAGEVIVIDGRTHLRWRLGSAASRVLLVGHHDTVWPIGSLETHPWRVEPGPDGDVARGPGCFDMKTGLVQIFHAVSVLPDPNGVTVLITGDEEIGSPTSRALIEAEARSARAAFILEASADGGAVKTQRKGVSLYDVEVQGLAAHAGLEPERGVNAGVELAHQVLQIARMGDPQAGTTVTPTAMSAGTTSNTVPAVGHLAVDVRAWTLDEQLDELMQSLTPSLSGSSIVVTGGPNRPPFEAAQANGLFALAKRLYAEFGLGELDAAAVGGASDGNFTAGVGTPTLDGLGAVGGGAHADHEHVVVSEIPRRTALLATLIESVLIESVLIESVR